MSSSKIKLITFDITNTLIRVRGSVGKQYSDLARKFDIKLDPDLLNRDFKKYFHEQNKLHPSYGYLTGITSQQWWNDIVLKLLKSQNIKEHKPNLYNHFSSYLFKEFEKDTCWQKYENCDYLLTNLKSLNYKIGLISNFDERLEKISKNLGLEKYFDFVLIPSKTKGLSKPNENIFLEAFKLGKVESSNEYLHIGDSIDLDFKPARALGFQSILIIHKSLKESHTFNENKNEEMKFIIENNLYATNLTELCNKIISL